MSFLSTLRSFFIADDRPKISDVSPTTENRNSNPFEVAMATDGWLGIGDIGIQSTSGVFVSRRRALTVPAIWSAVDTISKTLASLPFGIFRETEYGSEKAKGHPLYNIIRITPAPDLQLYNAYSFRYGLFMQACFGDAFVKIHRNGIGRPTNLELLNSEDVTVWQKPNGQPYYTVTRNVGGVSKFETLLPYEVLHIKGLTIDGIAGESVTSIHRDSIGTSIAAEQYGNFFFANGANPSGALVFPQELKKEQRDAAEKKISGKFGGVRNVGKTMVLDAGAKYEKFSLNPQEASLNDTRNFQVNQASRIFGVPVPLLAQMDKATLNNMETMGIQFVTLCLRPWAVQVEQEFAVKLLTQTELYSETYFFRFNFAGLLRGDTTARASYYKQALGGPSTGIGWMSVNEVRELENLDRVDDGDEVFTAEKMQASQNPEMAEPDDTTEEPDDTTEEPEDPEEPTNDTENGTPQASRKRAN